MTLHTFFHIWWHAAIKVPNLVLRQDGHKVFYNLMCTSEADAMEGIPKDSAVSGDLWVWWQNDLLHVFPASTTEPAFLMSKKADLKS